MNIAALYEIFKQHSSIQTDTRKLKSGDLFFALKGPNFNGNQFALQALEAGAAYAIVDEDIQTDDTRIIKTEDTLATLQQLAKYHRERFNIPFIAITGSNGKTTTKELVHAVLSSQYKTYTTQGNLNNHIGIPLTLLSVKDDAEMAVIEMGANHQKEIAAYCEYAKPTHGIITNAGKAHLEGFGGIEGVKKGKGELFDYLRGTHGTAFAFDDYNYLHEMIKGISSVTWYGTKNGTVTGDVKTSEPFLSVTITKGAAFTEINTQLVGAYNLPNILCATAVGKHFGVADEKIKQSIELYAPSNSRSQLIEKNGNKIILDAYNANPTSMKAAIENFAQLHAEQKILLLGGMMELGEESIKEHEALISLLKQYKWDNVILVGGDFSKVNHDGFTYLANADEARNWLQQQQLHKAYILVKGSRSMQMEKAIAF